jgi:mannose-6-phosphate isomerase-like protein (cupin superfamily)
MSIIPEGRVRRVVTTVNDEGKAVILFDSDNPNRAVRPGKNNVANLIWTTDQCPADIAGPVDRGAIKIGTSPLPSGSVFRILDYPPVTPEMEKMDASHRMKELSHEPEIRGLPPRHPFMHRTRTIDYAIILQGEIDMLLDDSEIHLKAGDVLVQQGTNHAWVNRGKEVCRIAFVLIDAKPI